MSNQDIYNSIAGAVIVGGLGMIWFFVRGYFNQMIQAIGDNTKAHQTSQEKFITLGKAVVRVEAKIDSQGKDIARMDGSVNTMGKDIRAASEGIYQAKMELKALWRVHDNRGDTQPSNPSQ